MNEEHPDERLPPFVVHHYTKAKPLFCVAQTWTINQGGTCARSNAESVSGFLLVLQIVN